MFNPICRQSELPATLVCHTPHCNANAFCCSACSGQGCLRLHQHEPRHIKFIDQVVPVLDELVKKVPVSIRKPNMENLDSRLGELITTIRKIISKFKEQLDEIMSSLINQSVNGLQAKLQKSDGRDLTGNDIHLLLSSGRAKIDSRKIREVECKIRMKNHQLQSVLVETTKLWNNLIQDPSKEWKDWQNKAKKYYDKGRKHQEERKYADAIEQISKAIEMDNSNPTYYMSKGICHCATGNSAQALKCCDEAILLDPRNYDYLNCRGNTHLHLRQHIQAASDYRQAIQCKPQQFTAYRNLGHTLFQMKNYSQALQNYSKVIELKRQKETIAAQDYAIRSNCYFDMNNFQEALDDCDRALQLEPESTKYLQNRAKILQHIPIQQRRERSILPPVRQQSQSDQPAEQSPPADQQQPEQSPEQLSEQPPSNH